MSEASEEWGELRAACQREPVTLFEWGRIFEARAELLELDATPFDVARYIIDSPAGGCLDAVERELWRFEHDLHQGAARIAQIVCGAVPMRGRWSALPLLDDVGAPLTQAVPPALAFLELLEARRRWRTFDLPWKHLRYAFWALRDGISVSDMAQLDLKPTRRSRRALRREVSHELFEDPRGARTLREPYRKPLAILTCPPRTRAPLRYLPDTIELADALDLDADGFAHCETAWEPLLWASRWRKVSAGEWGEVARRVEAHTQRDREPRAFVALLSQAPHAPGFARVLEGVAKLGERDLFGGPLEHVARQVASDERAGAWGSLLYSGGIINKREHMQFEGFLEQVREGDRRLEERRAKWRGRTG